MTVDRSAAIEPIVLPPAIAAGFGRALQDIGAAGEEHRLDAFREAAHWGFSKAANGLVAKADVADKLAGIAAAARLDTTAAQAEMAAAAADAEAEHERQLGEIDSYISPAEPKAPCSIAATPYRWLDPRTIPPREWLYDRHLIRRFLSVDVAAGAVGKTSLIIAEALSIATGRGLLTGRAVAPGRVWIWNGEDPYEELQRRIQAVCLHYEIDQEDIAGRLFVDSGRATPIVVAMEQRTGFVIAEPVVAAVKETIKKNKIDVFVVDPFVRSHRVSENDNGAINAVAEKWAEIADETNCAIDLVHHLKKTGGNEVSSEDARGASALVAAARSVRVMRRMTTAEAVLAGVKLEDRRQFFRVDAGDKANLAAPSDAATWRRLTGVSLGNATLDRPPDEIAVVTAWTWPDAFEGVTGNHLDQVRQRLREGDCRADSRSPNWAGKAVAEVLGIDLTDRSKRASVVKMLAEWCKTGALKTITKPDANRQPRDFLVPGDLR